jgi:hypothetical protein
LLPSYEGTFTPKGVRLHRRGGGEKVEFINHIASVSNHPVIERRCSDARFGGKIDPDFFRATFYVNPYRPRRIWHVDLLTGEPIELTLTVLKFRDSDLPFVMTLPDMMDRDKVESAEGIELNDARERKIGALEVEQRKADAEAEEAHQEAITSLGRTPPKAELRRDKRDNREAEKAESLFGMPISELVKDASREGADVAHESQKSEPHEDVTFPCEDTAPPPTSTPETVTEAVEHDRSRGSLLRAAIARLKK